jgi:hypothetical protein
VGVEDILAVGAAVEEEDLEVAAGAVVEAEGLAAEFRGWIY